MVPLSQTDLGRYIAYLSRRLCFSSVRQYLNVVRLVHLETGLKNPLEDNWYVTSILNGVRRVKGDTSKQKLPITLDILKGIFIKLNLTQSFDRAFIYILKISHLLGTLIGPTNLSCVSN